MIYTIYLVEAQQHRPQQGNDAIHPRRHDFLDLAATARKISKIDKMGKMCKQAIELFWCGCFIRPIQLTQGGRRKLAGVDGKKVATGTKKARKAR